MREIRPSSLEGGVRLSLIPTPIDPSFVTAGAVSECACQALNMYSQKAGGPLAARLRESI
jgi:hypothetical protein